MGGPQQGVAQEDPFEKSDVKNKDPLAGESESKQNTDPFAKQDPSTQTPVVDKSKNTKSTDNEFAKTRKRNAATEKVLDQLVQMQHEETPWGEIVDEISDKFGVQIHVTSSAVDVGFDREKLITVNFRKLRLRTALTTILSAEECTFIVEDGMIVIGDNSSCPLAVQTFDCKKILDLLPNSTRRASTGGGKFGGGVSGAGNSGQKSAGGGSLGAGSGGYIGGAGGANPLAMLMNNDKIDSQKQQNLVRLLEKMVAPETWDSSEGLGSLDFAGEILIVRQHGPQLHKVGQVLDDLQTMLEKQYPEDE